MFWWYPSCLSSSMNLGYRHSTLVMSLYCLMLNSVGSNKCANTCTMNVSTTETQTTMQDGTIEPQKKKKKRAAIWEYFACSSQNGETKLKCLSCPLSFSVTSGTSTLFWHAKTHCHFLEARQSTLTSLLQLWRGALNPAELIQDDTNRPLYQWSIH